MLSGICVIFKSTQRLFQDSKDSLGSRYVLVLDTKKKKVFMSPDKGEC